MGCFLWILAVSPVLYLLWKYLNKNFDYFSDRGIPYEKPIPIFGNMFGLLFLKRSIPDMLLNMSNKFRSNKWVEIDLFYILV